MLTDGVKAVGSEPVAQVKDLAELVAERLAARPGELPPRSSEAEPGPSTAAPAGS
jgi:hypothetical protein